MKRLFGFILRLAVIVALAVWLADRPGTARIVWHGYVIETSAAFLGLAGLAAGFVFYLLFRFWHFLRHGPALWRQGRKLKKMRQGHEQITEALIAVAAGDASEAGRKAVQARRLLGSTTLTQLLQAQAAQLAGDSRAAQEIFRALAKESESAVLGYRGLIMEARRVGDTAEMERLVEKLHRLRPETPWINLMRFEILARREAWDEATIALGQAASARLVEPVRSKRHRAALLVAASQQAARGGQNDKALQSAEQAAKQASDWLPAIINLAQAQMTSGHRRAAHRTIEKHWPRMAHLQLAEIWHNGESDPTEACKQIEKLCRDSEEKPVSRLAMAEAAFAADIWGEARRNLMALISRNEATQSVYRLMAKLERRETGDEQAAVQWMTRAADALPDPVWLCQSCGGGHKEWQALCAHCGNFDTLEWQSPGMSRGRGSLSSAGEISFQ